MKKNLLLAGLLTTFSLVAKSQVGINTTNPQGVFNIDGLKNNPTTGVPTAAQAKDDLVTTSNGNLGLGLTAPGTTLDVNGAITNRETALSVAGNSVNIPVNVSQVQLTGAATANVAITAFAAPNPGQRLIIYNNTTGGFGATLDGVTIPNGKALEFVFSNSLWRSTDGGTVGATPVNIYTANGTLTGNRTVTQGANTLAFTGTQTNAFSVDGNTLSVDAANGRVGVGTTTPDTKLTISTPDNSSGLNHTNGTINLKTFIGGGIAYIGTSTSTDLNMMTSNSPRMKITAGGDVGIGTSAPVTTLDVAGAPTDLTKKDGITPPRLTRQQLTNKGNTLYTASERGALIYITDVSGGTATSQRININEIGYYYFDGSVWQKMSPDISTPLPAYFRVTADIPDFLSAQGIGQETRVFNLSQIKNAIPGLTYNASTSTITFPAGTYQMTFVYEATHNATGCTLSSYYFDFPESSGTTRVHSTASHLQGASSNHGGSIIYTTTLAGGTTWQVTLGRGQSGNCLGTGMLLKARSTHLLIFRIGD